MSFYALYVDNGNFTFEVRNISAKVKGNNLNWTTKTVHKYLFSVSNPNNCKTWLRIHLPLLYSNCFWYFFKKYITLLAQKFPIHKLYARCILPLPDLTLLIIHFILTHFSLMFYLYTPWKQKTFGFLTFSGVIEIKQTKMG